MPALIRFDVVGSDFTLFVSRDDGTTFTLEAHDTALTSSQVGIRSTGEPTGALIEGFHVEEIVPTP